MALDQLNPPQQSAVRYIQGPLLVIAGAGSGKTRVITEKIAYLIEQGYPPNKIVAVTFTNKAAEEMRQRIGQRIKHRMAKQVRLCTFHTLGLDILKRCSSYINRNAKFSILDTADMKTMLSQIIQQHDKNYQDKLDSLMQQISSWKNSLIGPETALKEASDDFQFMAAKAYALYDEYAEAHNCVDFDDLIRLPVQLFERLPDLKTEWQHKIHYMLVDEYQDTNVCQYTMVKQLTSLREQFSVVGDDDQSIYAWRGAKPDNLLSLQKDYPRLKVIKLEQNYRSTKRILKAANTLIQNNEHIFEKKLWSDLAYGDNIIVMQTDNELDEAKRVCDELMRHKQLSKTKYSDYAILYRGNHQAKPIEQQLREQQIPYHLTGDTSFFARMEIKDIMAYCRLLANPDDDTAFLRIINIPKRQIGPQTLIKLQKYSHRRKVSLLRCCQEIGLSQVLNESTCQQLHAFSDWLFAKSAIISRDKSQAKALLNELISDIDYEGWLYQQHRQVRAVELRVGYVQDFINWINRYASTDKFNDFPAIMQHLTLLDLLEKKGDDDVLDEVQMMTLHAAKGLEFNHVFLIGMEEEYLPHKNSIEADSIDEERRLAYVGITRAKKTLYLTLANQRKRYGEMMTRQPSRFLSELPEEDLEYVGEKIQYTEEETEALANEHLAKCQALLANLDNE